MPRQTSIRSDRAEKEKPKNPPEIDNYNRLSRWLQNPSSAISRIDRHGVANDELSKGTTSRVGLKEVDNAHAMKELRRVVVKYGIPEIPGRPSLRPRLWKLFLQIDTLHGEDYLNWVSLGSCDVSSKIKNDTFRTLATDLDFKGKVREDMLIRMLEAFVWKNAGEERDGLPFTYVQGMNVLAAPFLYVMPSQLEAFACFSTFLETRCPLYVQPTMLGVHRGLELLDRCFEVVDPVLFDVLKGWNLRAEIWAFSYTLTFCMSIPPLDEAIKLWDFLLAYGVHLNILCVIAHVNTIREDIIAATTIPIRLLNKLPPLNARIVISLTLSFLNMLPESLYDELVTHPFQLAPGQG
ncbi:rab-GTPase-TBC domain-domain-containing protein [Naematelia encephala]|uniref:Rab-GTPase-TBC domain-domain-containing protein n=1 Tax=Naematelia encephala TaxID=71784 RepID=A0A1Y2B5N8_9TREE|nr:rab-GTPase-TBC domain-domain-containing protein [Naematelia encephala]